MTSYERGNSITAVIPTRNRPQDLIAAVKSISVQTHLPDELLIVDQSLGDESYDLVNSYMLEFASIKLTYVHDSLILGLVDAKRVAVDRAEGDIVCFLEDDVVLELDFIEEIMLGFAAKPNMLGCCGVITNPPNQTFLYKFLFDLFHCGIFRDVRVSLHGNLNSQSDFIKSNMLSGGLSAWRAEVFKVIKFDVKNHFHMFEDIDFSTRADEYFGPQFYINPKARLAHNCSLINRAVLGELQRRKLTEFIIYYKKRKHLPHATISFLWLLVGMMFEAVFQSFSAFSLDPIKGYFSGVKNGLLTKLVF